MGVAIGVAAFVTLVSLAWGFQKSWTDAYQALGQDLLVGKRTTRRPVPALFPATMSAELKKLPRVSEAAGVLTELMAIEEAPAVIVLGWETSSFLWNHLTLLEGRWPANENERAVALGDVAADILQKSVGDSVQIEAVEYRVCGRFAGQALSESGAVLMPLLQLQTVTGREGLVNLVSLKFKPGVGPEAIAEVRTLIRERFNGFSAYTSGEMVQHNITIQVSKAMSLATSLVALVVGLVGVINTILMSVIERLHEIAVLLALGWRRARVLKMILIESITLSFVGGLVGILLGSLALRALQMASWFRGKIDTEPVAAVLYFALIISLFMGALGGLYPAWRSTRIPIIEGLHHE
jgi:putative ABC transport system permease protein